MNRREPNRQRTINRDNARTAVNRHEPNPREPPLDYPPPSRGSLSGVSGGAAGDAWWLVVCCVGGEPR